MHPAEAVVQTFLRTHAEDGARVLEALPIPESVALLSGIPAHLAAPVLRRMAPQPAMAVLRNMPADAAAAVLAAMEPDQAAMLARRLPGDFRNECLGHMPEQQAEVLGRLLAYPEGTAGALMDVRTPALLHETPAGEAWEQVRATASWSGYYLYVIQRSRVLVGVLNLKELAAAPPERQLRSMMTTDVVTLRPGLSLPALVSHPAWSRFHTLPVVDPQKRFLGAIHFDAVRRMGPNQHTAGSMGVSQVGLALGELCWVGLSVITEGIARGVLGAPPHHNARED